MSGFYAYVRVSTVRQGEKGSSLLEQRAAIEAYAARHGLAILQWFEEMETAAKRGRRLFNQMLGLLDRGKAAGVIIHKIDRSARNLKDWADLGELMDRGLQVHFAYESLDLSSTGGRLAADLQAAVAAHYVRNLRDEINKGFRGRLRQGIYPWRAPLGYLDRGGGEVKVPDPARAPLIRLAFELYASGRHTLHTLRDEIERCGLRNRNGKSLSISGLSTLLRNVFYLGLMRAWDEMHQGKHAALISKSLFDDVQERLRRKARNPGLRHDFLYRRMLRCHHCAMTLIPERQKGKVYYRCHTKRCPTSCLREDAIDRQFGDALSSIAPAHSEHAEIAAEFDAIDNSDERTRKEDMRVMKLYGDKLRARLARLTDAFLDGSIDAELFHERKAAILHERAALQEKIDDVERYPETIRENVTKFLELLKALSNNAESRNAEKRRDLIKSTTSNLSVDRKNVVIAWRLPFSMLAERSNSSEYGDYRNAPRTVRRRRTRCESRSCRLARKVYRCLRTINLTGPNFTSPRPQSPPAPRPRQESRLT